MDKKPYSLWIILCGVGLAGCPQTPSTTSILTPPALPHPTNDISTDYAPENYVRTQGNLFGMTPDHIPAKMQNFYSKKDLEAPTYTRFKIIPGANISLSAQNILIDGDPASLGTIKLSDQSNLNIFSQNELLNIDVEKKSTLEIKDAVIARGNITIDDISMIATYGAYHATTHHKNANLQMLAPGQTALHQIPPGTFLMMSTNKNQTLMVHGALLCDHIQLLGGTIRGKGQINETGYYAFSAMDHEKLTYLQEKIDAAKKLRDERDQALSQAVDDVADTIIAPGTETELGALRIGIIKSVGRYDASKPFNTYLRLRLSEYTNSDKIISPTWTNIDGTALELSWLNDNVPTDLKEGSQWKIFEFRKRAADEPNADTDKLTGQFNVLKMPIMPDNLRLKMVYEPAFVRVVAEAISIAKGLESNHQAIMSFCATDPDLNHILSTMPATLRAQFAESIIPTNVKDAFIQNDHTHMFISHHLVQTLGDQTSRIHRFNAMNQYIDRGMSHPIFAMVYGLYNGPYAMDFMVMGNHSNDIRSYNTMVQLSHTSKKNDVSWGPFIAANRSITYTPRIRYNLFDVEPQIYHQTQATFGYKIRYQRLGQSDTIGSLGVVHNLSSEYNFNLVGHSAPHLRHSLKQSLPTISIQAYVDHRHQITPYLNFHTKIGLGALHSLQIGWQWLF